MFVETERFTGEAISNFDWDFAEAQFFDGYSSDYEVEDPRYQEDEDVYRPEMETYGRSLSTIRRLGAFMIENSLEDSILSPEAAQAKIEFYTSVEEGFGTDMELGGGLEVRDFDTRPVIDGRVMAKDFKTAVSAMTEAGLRCAETTALRDRDFAPQLTRSVWDHENALIVDKMARGETNYNTRIVVSPFPEEAAQRSGDEYWRDIGYVPHLRRGFVQLYHVTEDGSLVSGSLSFDGCNKKALLEIFTSFGVEIPEDEITDNWLKYAITVNATEADAKDIATSIADDASSKQYKKNTNTTDVTRKFRPVMERVFNESYVHICESLHRGYQTDGVKQLIGQLADQADNFNERYANSLLKMEASESKFSGDDSVVLHELLVYSTIEVMRAMHLKESEFPADSFGQGHKDVQSISIHMQTVDPMQFQNMLSAYAAEGARNNRTYSACGLSISAGETSIENSLQTAFGGSENDMKSNEEEGDCDFISKECPECGKKNVRTLVRKVSGGKKRISGDCGCSKLY